jgi:hypothetical protein
VKRKAKPKPINPWLIRWVCPSDRHDVGNMIAAILPGRTSSRHVKDIMHLLYANYSAGCSKEGVIYVSEQVRYAKGGFPYKVVEYPFEELICGASPYLLGRKVFNLIVSEVEGEWEQTMSWEENIYPVLDPNGDVLAQVAAAKPFKRRRWMFDAQANTITPVDGSPSLHPAPDAVS